MACMTLIAQPLAMATTQLPRAIQYQDAAPWQWNSYTEHIPVRMSWVVVTDSNGRRQLRMQWTPSADSR